MSGTTRSLTRLVLVGAGGHAREQRELIRAINAVAPRYAIEGFVVDRGYPAPGEKLRELPVLGGLDWLEAHRDEVAVVCAIGDSADRARMVARLRALGARFETLVHPGAIVSGTAELGEGAIVCAGAILTADLAIGAHSHVGAGSIVSHDCVLEDFVSLSPACHLAGAVHVERGARLGIGTTVRDRVTLGAWCITGAGAVVIANVAPNTTVVGVPARTVATRPAGWQDDPG